MHGDVDNLGEDIFISELIAEQGIVSAAGRALNSVAINDGVELVTGAGVDVARGDVEHSVFANDVVTFEETVELVMGFEAGTIGGDAENVSEGGARSRAPSETLELADRDGEIFIEVILEDFVRFLVMGFEWEGVVEIVCE